MKLKIPYLVATLVATTSLLYLADTPGLSAAQLVSFKTVSDQQIDLAAPLGKTRLVSFWAPDCAISERNAPDLSQLQSQFVDDEFEIVAIAMPYADKDDVQTHTKEVDYLVAHDNDGSVTKGFPGVRFTPTTFLIDGDGNIVWRHVGRLNTTKAASRITAVLLSDRLAENTVQLPLDGG